MQLRIRGPATRTKYVIIGRPRTPVSDCIRRRWKSSVQAGAVTLIVANDLGALHRRFFTSDEI